MANQEKIGEFRGSTGRGLGRLSTSLCRAERKAASPQSQRRVSPRQILLTLARKDTCRVTHIVDNERGSEF